MKLNNVTIVWKKKTLNVELVQISDQYLGALLTYGSESSIKQLY
jgi:hypothetical protein